MTQPTRIKTEQTSPGGSTFPIGNGPTQYPMFPNGPGNQHPSYLLTRAGSSMDIEFNPVASGPVFGGIHFSPPPGFPTPIIHYPQTSMMPPAPVATPEQPQEQPKEKYEPVPLVYPNYMNVYLPPGSQQQLTKYSKLVLMKHSAPIPGQSNFISFSPFYIRIEYDFPELNMELLRSSLAVKLGNHHLAIRFQNNEIDIRRDRQENRTITLLVKEHSILLPSHDSWKKLNPRADGIKLNVQLFLKKLRPLEVSFVCGHNLFSFTTPVICCAQTSFQNALKCYRDVDSSIKELQQWIENLQSAQPSTVRIRPAEQAFAEQEAQAAPKKRKLPVEYKSPGPLHEWYTSSPTTNTIESYFTFNQAIWSPLLQKNWEGIIKFFHDSVGEPTTAKIATEITNLFTPEHLNSNVFHTCSSPYFGGFVDPKRVVLLMKVKMMEEPEEFRNMYPNGCVIFVIWKNEKEKQYYYYLIESPYWDPIENKFLQTSEGQHRDKKFPCSIRKFFLSGEQQLHLVSSKSCAKLAKMPISYITKCWGGQEGTSPSLPVFQFSEEDWGQKSSEYISSIIEPRNWSTSSAHHMEDSSPPTSDDRSEIKQEPLKQEPNVDYLFQFHGADWEAGAIEGDMGLDGGASNPFYPSFTDDLIPDNYDGS